jgi:hypothetical protein
MYLRLGSRSKLPVWREFLSVRLDQHPGECQHRKPTQDYEGRQESEW